MDWILELKSRNEPLFYFGLANMGLAALFTMLSIATSMEVAGTNAWYKPIKFALSIGIYAWTLGWLMADLPPGRDVEIATWLIVILLGPELLYIAFQAGRGQLSHYNLSTPLYANMYTVMAVAATLVSFLTLYIAIKYFQPLATDLPDYYVWAVRLGCLLFFVFSLEGFVMGSRLSHTIGAADGGPGLPFLNWSRQFGDPRVAHFIGMHALQVLPLLAYYVLRDLRLTIGVAGMYGLLASYVLVQALQGKPFLKMLG